MSSAAPSEQCGANWTTRNTLVVCSFVIKIVYVISYFVRFSSFTLAPLNVFTVGPSRHENNRRALKCGVGEGCYTARNKLFNLEEVVIWSHYAHEITNCTK